MLGLPLSTIIDLLGTLLSGSPALWLVFSGALLAVLFTCNLKHPSTIANGRQLWLKNTAEGYLITAKQMRVLLRWLEEVQHMGTLRFHLTHFGRY